MKADKNFRMIKPTKRLLATITDKTKRSHFKKIMISAQLDQEANKKKSATSGRKESE